MTRGRKFDVAVVILAAGQGTRFKSRTHKLLHPLAGRPLGQYVLDAVRRMHPEKIFLVVGHQGKSVKERFAAPDREFITQEKQLGTGHALQIAKQRLKGCSSSHLLVLVGDIPLIRAETLQAFLESHRKQRASGSVLSMRLENPKGYGRVLRRGKTVLGIVEEKACTPAQKKTREVSSGILCFNRAKLVAHIDELSDRNPQKEYLLPELLRVFRRKRLKISAYRAPDTGELQGVNDRAELARIGKQIRGRKNVELMRAGVTILDPEMTYIDRDVAVGTDTVIEPGVSLIGNTEIGSECRIRAYSTLENTRVGDRVTVRPGCCITDSEIGSDAILGPYAHLRNGALIEPRARIGNFVEVKKSRVGSGSKALHLTYLGDTTLGERVNVGAGTVTCNYDGKKKHVTRIGDDCFIGSGSMLVAPVRIGKGSYVAAGSTITEDVPEESLAVGRAHQVNKEGWAKKHTSRKSKPAGPSQIEKKTDKPG